MAKKDDYLPFPLAYLDWVKEKKGVKTINETYNRDWVREFYYSTHWRQKPINGLDYAITMGVSL